MTWTTGECNMSTEYNLVPFTLQVHALSEPGTGTDNTTSLSSLFRKISTIDRRRAKTGAPKTKTGDSPALAYFKAWNEDLHQRFGPQPPGTTAALLRLLFPEEDTKRKYEIKEPRLVITLAKCYGFNPEKFAQWNNLQSSGCLGDEVRNVLNKINTKEDSYIGPLTVLRVDELLDELAALSEWSDQSIRDRYPKPHRKRLQILCDLYRDMSPEDASYLTQIILKDLRPLLYPLQDRHTTAALLGFNSAAVKMLTKYQVMVALDPSRYMVRANRVWSDLGRAADIAEMPQSSRPEMKPTIGVAVDVPKSLKGQGCKNSLKIFQSCKRVWAETKYDGERAQIHVTVCPDGTPPIVKIFSKSRRDSTEDRHAVHEIIREALGFHRGSGRNGTIKQSVILDAEMVAFEGHKVDEFWRIRRLIGTTAHGVRGKRFRPRLAAKSSKVAEDETETQGSLISDDSVTRNLGLVFFDIMSLDGESLMNTPYTERRRGLEGVIQTAPGRAILANRFEIDMGKEPDLRLARIFAEHIADFQEGLVLKAEESSYNDYPLKWVKVKKDYIPGYGDPIDMILVGASWNKERGRELRVAPQTYTTFYFGALRPASLRGKPHVEVLFTASYGQTRQELEDLNFLLSHSDTLGYNKSHPEKCRPRDYTFNVYPGLDPPSIILEEPILVELCGAGFSKAPQCDHYELRWPRITKVHRRKDRSWTEGLDLKELRDIAYASVGRDTSDKTVQDDVAECWGKKASPGIRCPKRRRQVAAQWEEKLCAYDRGDKRASAKRVWVEETDVVEEPLVPSKPDAYDSSRFKRPKLEKMKMATEGSEGTPASKDHVPLVPVTNILPRTPPRRSRTERSPESLAQDNIENGPRIQETVPHPLDQTKPQDRQLPTPSTSPARAQERRTPVMSPTARDILTKSHVFSLQPGGWSAKTKCSDCSKLRKHVSRGNRIHSLESLLSTCGWGDDASVGRWVESGAVLAEAHGDLACNPELDRLLARLEDLRKRGGERKPVAVITCDGQVRSFV